MIISVGLNPRWPTSFWETGNLDTGTIEGRWCWKPPGRDSHLQAQERGLKQILPHGPQKEPALQHLDCDPLTTRTVRREVIVVQDPLCVVLSDGSPSKLIQMCLIERLKVNGKRFIFLNLTFIIFLAYNGLPRHSNQVQEKESLRTQLPSLWKLTRCLRESRRWCWMAWWLVLSYCEE